MLVSGLAQSGQNLALSRLAITLMMDSYNLNFHVPSLGKDKSRTAARRKTRDVIDMLK